MKYPAHSFLFDEDDDTDRSVQAQGSIPYSPVKTPLSNRYSYLTPKSSGGNYSLQQHRGSNATTLFTCCGFSIDLSHKHSYSSNSKSVLDDSSTRRSTICKNPNLSSKNLGPPSFISSNDRFTRQQKTVCYRSTNTNRPITRRRAATVVHCSRNTPVSTITSLTSRSSIPLCISKEKQSFTTEKLSPIIDTPLIKKDESKISINLTEPPFILQIDYLQPPSPASIIETC